MIAIRFARRGATYAVTSRYNPDVVATIRSVVAGFARNYNPATRTWLIDAAWAGALASALRAQGFNVTGIAEPAPPTPNRDWAAALLAAVGPDRVDAAVRALSRVLHPDVSGGDADLQRQLLAARDELRRR